MLKADIEACKEIARLIAREEIAKAVGAFQKTVVSDPVPATPEPEVEKEPAKVYFKKI